jgi:hypothetical protein
MYVTYVLKLDVLQFSHRVKGRLTITKPIREREVSIGTAPIDNDNEDVGVCIVSYSLGSAPEIFYPWKEAPLSLGFCAEERGTKPAALPRVIGVEAVSSCREPESPSLSNTSHCSMSFLAKRVGSNAFRATSTINSYRQFSSTSPAMTTLAEVRQNCRKVRDRQSLFARRAYS